MTKHHLGLGSNMKKLLFPVIFSSLVACSFAQGMDGTPKGFGTLGLFFPTNTGGISTTAGLSLDLGYTFIRKPTYDISVISGARSFGASNFEGSSTVTLGTFMVRATTRPQQEKGIWFGLALGETTLSESAGGITISDSARPAYSLLVGSNLTPRTYLELSYMTTFSRDYQNGRTGLSLAYGYRF